MRCPSTAREPRCERAMRRYAGLPHERGDSQLLTSLGASKPLAFRLNARCAFFSFRSDFFR